MHAKHSFEYAVLRAVPRVEREEFVNVGVVLFCKSLRFLEMKSWIDVARLSMLHDGIDISSVHGALRSFDRIVKGEKSAGPIALLDRPERFRWLTAVRSTVLQTSRVHPGLCSDPAGTLEKLFVELVM
jgi:hypothetical protein